MNISSSNKLFIRLSALLGKNQEDIRHALSSEGILRKSGLLSPRVGQHLNTNLADSLELISDDFADSIKSSVTNPVMLLRSMTLPGKAPQLNLSDYPQIEQELSILLPYLRESSLTRKTGVNIFIHGRPGEPEKPNWQESWPEN
ncbi:MAG: hypothetical protein NC211_08905 [Alistipes senegalensis]|nr:hypothetical protein [Oxalobacter formigenes]MCM1281926.1 hypothetical protein [Alistipes senegalensis]